MMHRPPAMLTWSGTVYVCVAAVYQGTPVLGAVLGNPCGLCSAVLCCRGRPQCCTASGDLMYSEGTGTARRCVVWDQMGNRLLASIPIVKGLNSERML